MFVFASVLEIEFIVVFSGPAFDLDVSLGKGDVVPSHTPIFPNVLFGFLGNCAVE